MFVIIRGNTSNEVVLIITGTYHEELLLTFFDHPQLLCDDAGDHGPGAPRGAGRAVPEVRGRRSPRPHVVVYMTDTI